MVSQLDLVGSASSLCNTRSLDTNPKQVRILPFTRVN